MLFALQLRSGTGWKRGGRASQGARGKGKTISPAKTTCKKYCNSLSVTNSDMNPE